ncbi:hypothetical protein TNCV_3896351 [Trichonephila clavipes]|nr:hypothetical protein TNCV_3896351 [Trichonephila clavipes]
MLDIVNERGRRYDNVIHINIHKPPYHRFQNNVYSLLKLVAAPDSPNGIRRNAYVPFFVTKAVLTISLGFTGELKVPGP